LDVGGVGEVHLDLGDDLRIVHLLAFRASLGELHMVADLFAMTVIACVGVVGVYQSAALELLVEFNLDLVFMYLDLLLGQAFKQGK